MLTLVEEAKRLKRPGLKMVASKDAIVEAKPACEGVDLPVPVDP